MVKIILAIFILGVIVALHEFGHFIVAKLCGIRVNQFAIGMGPAILKKQWGETEYSLRLLPIGGFCAMEGEDADSEDSRAFGKKSVPRRMAVVVAGATMNILLGFVLLIITTSMGDAITTTTISRFHADENGNSTSSSESCGLQVNDTIVRINGMRILTDTDLSYKLQYTNENDFTVDVRRNGEIVTLEHVRFEDTATTGRLDFWVYGQKTTVGNVLAYAAKDTVSIARMTWVGLLVINSLLVLPGAAARNVAGSMRSYHLLALIFGLFSGVLGLFLSYFNAVAAGPTIVLVAAALFFGTFLLRDKNRG